jgi:hypothetical protein
MARWASPETRTALIDAKRPFYNLNSVQGLKRKRRMQGILTTFDDASAGQGRDFRRVFLQIGPGVVVVAALTACVSAWVLHGRPAAAPDIVVIRSIPVPIPVRAPAAQVAANPYGDIVDPGFFPKPTSPSRDFPQQASLEAAPRVAPAPRAEAVPLPPRREVDQIDENAPLPPPRPGEFATVATPVAPDHGLTPQTARTTSPAAPPDNRTIFEKLFGTAQSNAAAVAYTPPEGRLGGKPFFTPSTSPPPGYDQWTAVYDISARTVYLPNGTRLEAHSGLGDLLDDPRRVSERDRGATPPHLYELEPREASFHGVQALRLKPIGDGDLFGRAGLLAHSYMLGPNGDSNGCVSFKDYEAFLRAYQSGQVRRLAVVARLN